MCVCVCVLVCECECVHFVYYIRSEVMLANYHQPGRAFELLAAPGYLLNSPARWVVRTIYYYIIQSLRQERKKNVNNVIL